jgi:hypothetical protein
MTPEHFFSKNLKWITLVLVLLLILKFVQGCNRNMGINMDKKKYTHEIDSLKRKYNNYYQLSQDSIKELNFQLRMANERALSANDKAQAIQNAVEKIKNNTTITVQGAEEIKDTNKKNNK